MNLILFDGECPLCHRLVRFLVKHTSEEELLFAPLGGETAAHFGFNKEFPSVVFIAHFQTPSPEIEVEGRAALKAVGFAGGILKLANLLLVLPECFLDPPYQFFASRRSRNQEACKLSSLESDISHRLLP